MALSDPFLSGSDQFGMKLNYGTYAGANAVGLTLQLPFFEMSALRGGLVDSAPERPSDDMGGLNPLSSEPDGDSADFLD